VTATYVTHMAKRYAPVPRPLDDWLKRHFGWLLIAEFRWAGGS
jgi:hypothetical protein